MCACYVHECTLGNHRKVLDSLELVLPIVAIRHICAEN